MRLLVLLLCATASFAASAYEEDVHFGLTHWLAVQAGFDRSEAEVIATANVEYDHSGLSATFLVMHFACFSKEPKLSELVRDYHFPSAALLPSPPEDRVVTPNSDEARQKTNERIAVPGKNRPQNLRALGAGLHPLQDSWSHRGIPGSPTAGWFGDLFCDHKLSWGHPSARGGWREHFADITSWKPFTWQETVEMAEASYSQLCRWRRDVDSQPCDPDFSRLRSKVEAFAKASTKQAKRDWFLQEWSDFDTQFLDLINIGPGSGYDNRSIRSGSTRVGKLDVPYSRFEAVLSEGPVGFMQQFFGAFMTRPAAEVVDKFFARERFAKSRLVPREPSPLDRQTLEAIVNLWQVRDHGAAVARLGTHDLASVPGQAREQARWLQTNAQPYQSAEEALLPLDSTGRPVVARDWETPDKREFRLGLARLRHAPHEIVLAVAEKVDNTYWIVAILSAVDH